MYAWKMVSRRCPLLEPKGLSAQGGDEPGNCKSHQAGMLSGPIRTLLGIWGENCSRIKTVKGQAFTLLDRK